MGSRRLPGKVLARACGLPLLQWLVERVRPARLIGGIVVATTNERHDDAVARLCADLGVPCFRGHATDVLARYVAVVDEASARSVVRVTGDAPFVDAATVDTVIAGFFAESADLVQNHRQPGWPIGTSVEVMTTACLRRLDREASGARTREHVTLHAYEHPKDFAVNYVPPPPSSAAPTLRLCVDTIEDLQYIRRLCAAFAPRRDFTVAEIVQAARNLAR